MRTYEERSRLLRKSRTVDGRLVCVECGSLRPSGHTFSLDQGWTYDTIVNGCGGLVEVWLCRGCLAKTTAQMRTISNERADEIIRSAAHRQRMCAEGIMPIALLMRVGCDKELAMSHMIIDGIRQRLAVYANCLTLQLTERSLLSGVCGRLFDALDSMEVAQDNLGVKENVERVPDGHPD